jgi:ABC-2 type transport system permease protein
VTGLLRPPAPGVSDVDGRAAALPGRWSAALARSGAELRGWRRNRTALVFTMAFPVGLLVVFGGIVGGEVEHTGVDVKQVLVAGILAAGIMSVAFQGLAISIAVERDAGLLRRLAYTPMPKSAYFGGKVARVALTAAVEVAVLLAISVAAFGLRLPTDPARWLTLAWVAPLGAAACALAAVAYSRLIPNAGSASAVVTPVFVLLQLVSGVFVPFNQLPGWLQQVAAVFPLKWLAQGLRSVFLPDSFTAVEPAGGWELGRVALVLAGWCVAGAMLAALTFRWRGEKA